MRKIYLEPKHKRHQRRICLRIQRSLIKKHKHQKIGIKQHRHHILAQEKKYHTKRTSLPTDKKQKGQHLIAPVNFSYRENPEKVSHFINCMNFHLSRGRNIFIDMKNIDSVSVDALLAVVAILDAQRKIKPRGHVEGNLPNNKKISQLIIDYGFLKAIKAQSIANITARDSKFFTIRSGHKVEPSIIKEVLDFAGCTNEKNMRTQKKLYHSLLEFLGNAHEHAYTPQDTDYKHDWYISAQKMGRSVSFTILDNGQGIAKTIRKGKTERAKMLLQRLMSDLTPNMIQSTMDATLIKAAFTETGRSQTGENYRGKGLPFVFLRNINEGFLKDFTVISNKGYVKISNHHGIFSQTISENFRGTLYYWNTEIEE